MKYLLKFTLNFLGNKENSSIPSLNKKEKFRQAQLMIRIFYLLIFFFESGKFLSWPIIITRTNIDPIWPVYWLNYIDTQTGILIILWLGLISSLLAITFPNLKITRILVCLSLLESVAFRMSFGTISHGSHLTILLSAILIFLPSQWSSLKHVNRYTQSATLMVFSSCQALIMLTYTMAGIGKIYVGILQVLSGEISEFAPPALALHLAYSFAQKDSQAPLGIWMIQNYYFVWPLMLGTIYLQFFSLWAAFRPSLHQIWGFSLILFHLVSIFAMQIAFQQNILWIGLFFLNSPFRPIKFSWQQIINNLPVVDYLVRNISLINYSRHQH